MIELMFLAATAGAQAAIHSYFDPLQRWKLSAPPSDLAVQPLLVYIPGLDGTNASPFAQFPRLAEQFRVRAQEVSAEPSACEASFEALVEDVAAYLREHGSTEHGNVVMGESMGGVVAAGVALQHPELVSGLILVNPATALSVMPDLQSVVRCLLSSRPLGWRRAAHGYNMTDETTHRKLKKKHFTHSCPFTLSAKVDAALPPYPT